MPPREKRPAVLRTPWPPVDAKTTATPIAPWDDWWNLATNMKRDDVWDIIYYNFETYNPDEVNWYMRERLGCRLTTANGLNYRFGREPGNNTPITVYIPPDDYFPPGPKQAEAKAAVLQVLREPAVWTLNFRLGTFELRMGDLMAVEQGIENGKITVIHRPSLGHMAQYWPGRNLFLIPFGQVPPVSNRGLIVHEAIHAAMDIRRMRLTMAASEGIAYIAQALYLLHHGIDMGTWTPQPAFNVAPRNFVAWRGIFSRAGKIAAQLAANQPVDDSDLLLLGLSLVAAPTYTTQGAPNNDGI